MTCSEAPRRITVQPLTAAAFAPFGQVTDLASGERRTRVQDAFVHLDQAVEPRMWIANVQRTVTLPLTLSTMERHPYSTQTFVPVNGCDYIVVAGLARADGRPDVGSLQAFLARPDQAVTYGLNVWHHGLTVLQAPASFVVCMTFSLEGGDDVFVPLDAPVELVAPEH